jgi:hypothetical protein
MSPRLGYSRRASLQGIDLSQKTGHGGVKIDRIGLDPAQVGNLMLEMTDTFQRDL